MSTEIAAVVPIHRKDLGRLSPCIGGLRRNVVEIGEIFVVGARELAPEVARIAALAGVSDVRFVPERDHFRTSGGWLLQQEIKLRASAFVSDEQYVVVDADTYFLNRTRLRDAQGRPTFARDVARGSYWDHRKACHCFRYLPTIHHVFGLPHEHHRCCSIAHHMVFDVDLVAQMSAPILDEGLERVFERVRSSGASFSEFDTYGAFVRARAPKAHVWRDEPWADVPWPRGMSEPQRRAYLDRFAEAGHAFVSAHSYLEGYETYEGAMAFADWLAARTDAPAMRAGRWALQQWRRRRRSAAQKIAREIERALDARIRGLASYCFVSADGESISHSEALYLDARLARVGREIEGMHAVFEGWSALDGRPEIAVVARSLGACARLLDARPPDLPARLPGHARAAIGAWQAMAGHDLGRRLTAPLDALSVDAIGSLVQLMVERRSDPDQLLDLVREILPPSTHGAVCRWLARG